MKWLKLALSLVIVAGAFAAIRFVAWTPVRCNDVAMRADEQMKKIVRLSDPTLITIATREDLARLEPCRREVPWNINLHLLAGANYAVREQHAEAIRVYQDALRYDRRPEIYFHLGQELLKTGRTDEALEPLTIACRVRSDFITDIPDPVRSTIIARVAQLPAPAPPRYPPPPSQ
jgi:hypothetical protein